MIKTDEIKNIDGINDIRLLILLKGKRDKSRSDANKIKKLTLLYPKHNDFEMSITSDLEQGGYIEYIGETTPNTTTPPLDERCDPIYEYESVTTDSGILAIKSGLFRSESAEYSRKERLRRLDIAFKWFAIIGGALGLINFLLTLFKS